MKSKIKKKKVIRDRPDLAFWNLLDAIHKSQNISKIDKLQAVEDIRGMATNAPYSRRVSACIDTPTDSLINDMYCLFIWDKTVSGRALWTRILEGLKKDIGILPVYDI